LIDLAVKQRVPRVAIHAFMDGRDTMPNSGLGYMRELLKYIESKSGDTTSIRVASVSGRYYIMDRDKRWQRTELGYRAAVDGVGPTSTSPLDAIQKSYDAGVTDEFIIPVVIVDENDKAVAPMRDGDEVIGFNYRADRMRQIVQTLIDPGFSGFDVSHRPRVHVTSLTQYDKTLGI